ncbi:MAG: D-alanine--D-alanine ligase family protein [Patescibacteria group bacterium]|jgi:D-alanine-D-alanine ligase
MNIGVFFGSRSPEHDVSIITGEFIISGLKKLNYEVAPVYLDKQGRWFLSDELSKLSFFKDGGDLSKLKPYYLDLEKSIGKMVFKQKGMMGKEIIIDLAFPAFHGQNGEDGTIQGLFELCNIPYVGCDVASSAITMDKVLTKEFYLAHNIKTTKFISFSAHDFASAKEKILQKISELKYPLFIKPARLGSSIGIAKAKNQQELEQGIEVSLHYENKILVEEGVEDLMDVTCAVLGNENPRASVLQESLFNEDLFSYEDKYLEEGGAQLGNAEDKLKIPARLDQNITKQTQELAVKIYKLFGCSGISRVDFLYDKKANIMYANEINTLPGTLYHHLWQKSGVEFEELLKELINLAQEKYTDKQKLTSSFESEILKQANSIKLKQKN